MSKSIIIQSYDHLDIASSDHDLIITQLKYKSLFKWGKNIWRDNCQIYKDDDFINNFKKFWIIESQDVCRKRNPNKWWVNTKYKFKLCSIQKGKENAI